MNIEKNDKFRVEIYRNNDLIFESENPTSILDHLIYNLSRHLVKDNNTKIDQYYYNNNEYCYYKTISGGLTTYVIGMKSEWGNHVNFTQTLRDNKIEIIKLGDK